VAEAERELDSVRALRCRAVADADDLELLYDALGDADDHVVDERPGEPVLRAVLALVVRALHEQLAVVLADRDHAGDVSVERALRARDGDVTIGDRHGHAARHGDGGFTDSRHRSRHHT
jgi:hypothetical protein